MRVGWCPRQAGLYDDFVMLLDFNSAQSSAQTLPALSDRTDHRTVLRRLVDSRRQVKAAIKTAAIPETWHTTWHEATDFFDSIWMCMDAWAFRTVAMQIGEQIKRSVNKRYKRLEIEIDGVFAGISVFPKVEVHAVLWPVIFAKVRLMLLKKKKYAAMKAGTHFNFVSLTKGWQRATWQVVDWQKQLFETEFKGNLDENLGHKIEPGGVCSSEYKMVTPTALAKL
eukprot:Skav224933  [mRNA]  locus=scaffold2105:106189:109302:- [translate_table: standard]